MTFVVAALLGTLALALGAAGCGGSSARQGDRGLSPGTGVRGPAAGLQADLTAGLVAQAQLSGLIAVQTARDGDPAGAGARAAAAVAGENAGMLAARLGSVYGARTRAQLTTEWTRNAELLQAVTAARLSGEPGAAARAGRALATSGRTLATVLARANPELSAADTTAALQDTTDALLAGTDAALSKSASLSGDLQRAGETARATARLLTTAIVRQFPKRFGAAARGSAAELRATLTAQLADHAYLAYLLADATIASKRMSAGARAARATLDENTVALSQTIASVYGDDVGAEFRSTWRAYVRTVEDYTTAKLSGDKAQTEIVLDQLDRKRRGVAQVLSDADGRVQKSAVADRLAPQVTALAAAVRARVKRSPKTVALVRDAAGETNATAAFLADALVARLGR